MIYLPAYFVLCRVAEHSDSNKMDAHNLAVVFGPTLLRIPSEQDMIAYQSQVNGMMELLIKHCAEIFPGSGEPLHAPLSETEESDSEEGIACLCLFKKISYRAIDPDVIVYILPH